MNNTNKYFDEVSLEEFSKDIKKSKKINIITDKPRIKQILESSGYKFKNNELFDENGNPVFSNDGKPVNKNCPYMLAGSNVFIPKNKAALFKYYSEHK